MAAPAQEAAPIVLVVDDEPMLLQLMARALREAGYTLSQCGGSRSRPAAWDLARFGARTLR